MKNIKIWIGILYLILLSVFLYFLFSKFSIKQITTYNFVRENSGYLVNFREQNLILISIVFIILGIFWISLLQGFASPLILASGFIFGKYLGIIIIVITLSLGSSLTYIVANFFFKDLIREKFSNKFENLEIKFKKKEFFYMLIYRFVGGIPFQLSNIIPCIFNIRIKIFLFASLLGLMPQAFIIASLGAGLESQIEKNSQPPTFLELIKSFEIYAPILGFLILLILGFALRKFFYKN